MPNLEQLKALGLAIIHKNCADGLAAAMILRDVLPTIQVSFVQYSTREHQELVAQPGMIFADFSPYRDRAKDFLEAGAIVLDHHAKAWDICKPFVDAGLGAFGHEKTEPGVSGALLTYKEVWVPLYRAGVQDAEREARVAQLAMLAGIYDTWQTKNPLWEKAREQTEALVFWHREHCLGTPWNKWDELLVPGRDLRKRTDGRVKMLLGGASRFTSPKGRRVVAFDGLVESSIAAEAVGQQADLVTGFGIFISKGEVAPKLHFSCRAHTGFDVGAFAVAHGGGGHSAAAHLSVTLERHSYQPFTILEELLKAYEPFEDRWLSILQNRQEDPDFKPVEEYQRLRLV